MHAGAALAAGIVESHMKQHDAAARRAIGDRKGGCVERQILHDKTLLLAAVYSGVAPISLILKKRQIIMRDMEPES
jgi:hypothetical protein